MKSTFFFSMLFVVVTAQISWSQIPQTMSYQGVLIDADGNAVADGNFILTFKLYDVDTNGEALYQETHNEVNVTGGIFSVIIGSANPLNLPFDKPYWLGITIGSEDPELTPRIQLTSSGYSLNSKSVIDDAVSTEKIQDGAVTDAKIAGGQVVKSLNGLKDDVTIEAGNSVTITQSGDTLTIEAAGSIIEPPTGQGLIVRNEAGEATHILDPDGNVTHAGKGTFGGA